MSKNNQETGIQLSVVCNTFNAVNRIEAFISAYLQQKTTFNWELIIVDDGSTDDTLKKCTKFQSDKRLKIISGEHVGPSEAKNQGINAAKGEVIVLVGDDILPVGNFLQTHWLSHTMDYPELTAIIVGHTEWAPYLRNDLLHEFMTKSDGLQFAYEHIRNHNLIDYRFVYTSNVSFKKALIRKTKQYFNVTFQKVGYEDTEWAYRLQRSGATIRYNRKIEALHYHKYSLKKLIQRQKNIGSNSWLTSSLCPELEEYLGTRTIIDLYRLYNLDEKQDYHWIELEISRMEALLKVNLRFLKKWWEQKSPLPPNKTFEHFRSLQKSLYQDLWYLCDLARYAGMIEEIKPIFPAAAELALVRRLQEKYFRSSKEQTRLSSLVQKLQLENKNHFLVKILRAVVNLFRSKKGF